MGISPGYGPCAAIGYVVESLFRYARTACLETEDNGAALTFEFTGTGVALGLGQHAVSAYGRPSLGKLIVTVDDGSPRVLYPGNEAREVVLARGLTPGKHRVRVVHRLDGVEMGCRVSGFRVLAEHSGDLSFVLNGEENGFFVDARAVVRQGDQIVRNRAGAELVIGGMPSDRPTRRKGVFAGIGCVRMGTQKN